MAREWRQGNDLVLDGSGDTFAASFIAMDLRRGVRFETRLRLPMRVAHQVSTKTADEGGDQVHDEDPMRP
jgi:pyridoxal/pyridoxine/pyridoxamine kinase